MRVEIEITKALKRYEESTLKAKSVLKSMCEESDKKFRLANENHSNASVLYRIFKEPPSRDVYFQFKERLNIASVKGELISLLRTESLLKTLKKEGVLKVTLDSTELGLLCKYREKKGTSS